MFQLLQPNSNGPDVARKGIKAVEEIEKNEMKAVMLVNFECGIIGLFLFVFGMESFSNWKMLRTFFSLQLQLKSTFLLTKIDL